MTRGSKAEQVCGRVHRVRAVVVILVEGEQLRGRQRLVVAGPEFRQFDVETIHVHVDRQRLDCTLLMHDTAPGGPLRTLGCSVDTSLDIGYTLYQSGIHRHDVWGWASAADAYCS